jgi:hypothetical protein
MHGLNESGTTANLVENEMVTLHECFDTLGLTDMLALDAQYAR